MTSLFLAGRYLRPRRNAVSVITLISIIGVTLGVAVLMIVLAVMTGFTDLMKTKLLETQSHFTITEYGGIRNPDPLVKIARQVAVDACPVIQHNALAQFGKQLDPQVMVFGAEPETIRKHIDFVTALQRGKADLAKGEAVISYLMAERWNVRIGDKILLHSPSHITALFSFKPGGGVELNQNASLYLPSEFTVAGIYSLGKYDFDNSVLFLNRDDAAELYGYPWGAANAIYGWVKDPFAMDKELNELKALLPGRSIVGWQQRNAQMLGVLAVEKRMMFFLLIFIVLVAAFSITNTLITSVYQKTREIGILKSLGASDGTVMRIFVLQGFLVGAIGAACGAGLGCLVLHYRNAILDFGSRITGQELFPKQFYFFNGLPCHIVPGDVIFIVLSAIILCTAGAVIPALRAARLDPAKALRYE